LTGAIEYTPGMTVAAICATPIVRSPVSHCREYIRDWVWIVLLAMCPARI